MSEVRASPLGRSGFVGWANAREVRSGMHGSCVLAVTVDSGNADAPIIDIKPREQDCQHHKARRPLLRHPLPDPPGSRLCDDAALAAAMAASHLSTCS
jgi:hypothetical protein